MTTKTDDQERRDFELWHDRKFGKKPLRQINSDRYAYESHQSRWESYRAGRAALQSQPQKTIAYVTRNEEGDPAMLFFDLKEARLYCDPDEEPEALVLAVSALQSQDREDALRYRWLCDKFGITKLPCAIERIIAGDVYVADGKAGIDEAIDHARRIEGDGK